MNKCKKLVIIVTVCAFTLCIVYASTAVAVQSDDFWLYTNNQPFTASVADLLFL